MLWEYSKPKSFSDIHCRTADINNLELLSASILHGKLFPNMIIHGPPHSGKYMKVQCFLESIFGKDIYEHTEITHTARQNCSNYTIQINKSNHHYETSFSGLQYADKTVLNSLLNTFFSTTNVSSQQHKILVIRNFDELTKPAQYSLRRRIETDIGAVRYIFIVNHLNFVEPALLSRCVLIRCPKLSIPQIQDTLTHLCTQKNVDIPPEYIEKVSKRCDRKVGNAIHLLECMYLCKSDAITCPVTHAIQELVEQLTCPEYECEKVREIISKLQLSRICHTQIFRAVIRHCETLSGNTIHDIVSLAAKYDIIIQKTKKYSIGIESFIVKVFKLIHHKVA